MRFRIVERKDDSGKSYYIIQYRRFWIWWNYRIDEVWENDRYISVDRLWFSFNSEESAKSALERTQMKYNYKGITIYPTIKKDMFYSLLGAKKHEKYDWYVNLIYGSYEECCGRIEGVLAAKKNRKYKKIIEI